MATGDAPKGHFVKKGETGERLGGIKEKGESVIGESESK